MGSLGRLSVWFTIAVLLTATRSQAQRFTCDGQLVVAAYDGYSTRLYRPIFIPFGIPFFVPIVRFADRHIDAIGFNAADHYLYGVDQASKEIIRMYADGRAEPMGSLALVDSLHTFAGDCTPTGQYICQDYERNELLVFDVVDGLQLSDRIPLTWSPSNPVNGAFSGHLFDLAVDPNNPSVAYTYLGRADDPRMGPALMRGQLLEITLEPSSPALGQVAPVAEIADFNFRHLGGLLFSPNGRLYGYGSQEEGYNPRQNRLSRIDPFGGDVIPVLTEAVGHLSSDGCSCPYAFTFQNFTPAAGIFCNNDTRTFTLVISNSSYNTLSGISLRDTFPQGMVIDAVSESFDGQVLSGVGGRILAIDDLIIGPRTQVNIDVEIRTIDIEVGGYTNQAFLYNLPERFERDLASDNAFSTAVEGDPSYFEVIPRPLTDVTFEVELPTDCLDANDGKITVASPEFLPGQTLEVKLRNQEGWTEQTRLVTVTEEQRFTVDSLIPGDYQLFSLRTTNELCSFAVKDTSIVLAPPNHLLTLDLSSNGPLLCEGASLQLLSEQSPGGAIQWRGPALWSSEAVAPRIDSATAIRSGEYRAVATYGYCEQTRTLDIEVKKAVNATVSGPQQYCLRDTIYLRAAADQDSLRHQWSTPQGQVYSGAELLVPVSHTGLAGDYQAVVTNGACYDTVAVTVHILPTPTVSLPATIKPDFCNDVFLQPDLRSPTTVSYSWQPSQGLSCTDCENPRLTYPVQPNYQVQVASEFCSDSAAVAITVEQEEIATAPTVFRPSSTTGNDRFAVVPRCMVHRVTRLTLFDRWGSVVFDTNGQEVGDRLLYWDGHISGRMAMPGVYRWTAVLELINGDVLHREGSVLLMR